MDHSIGRKLLYSTSPEKEKKNNNVNPTYLSIPDLKRGFNKVLPI